MMMMATKARTAANTATWENSAATGRQTKLHSQSLLTRSRTHKLSCASNINISALNLVFFASDHRVCFLSHPSVKSVFSIYHPLFVAVILCGDVTPTAGHQLDIPPVHQSRLVAGLAAQRHLLGLVEGHLAAHLAGFTSLAEGDVAPDAQHLGLGDERLPHRCGVAAPGRSR